MNEAADAAPPAGGDQATADAVESANERVTIENAFAKYDTDRSGFIEADELRGLLAELGATLSPKEAKRALQILDVDGSGMIELEEFKQWWETKDAAETAGDDVELRRKLERVAATGREQHRADIHVAAWRGNVQLMRQFLDLDPSLVSAADDSEVGERYTPLHYAAYQGHLDMCTLLLDSGADANALTDSGCSPLFLAAQQLHTPVLHLLLRRGADPTLGDNKYRLSPLDVCPPPLWEAFKEHGCSAPEAPGQPTARRTKATEARVTWPYAYPQRPGRQGTDGRWHIPGSLFQLLIRVLPEGEGATPVDWGRLKTFYGTTEAVVDGLEPGARYTFAVRAINPLGKSPESPPSEPFLLASRAPPPSAPEPSVVADTYVTLQWAPPRGVDPGRITGYAVRFRPLNEHGIPTGPSRRVATGEECTHTLSRLEPGQAYRVGVAAVTQAGMGQSSQPAVVRTEVSAHAARRRRRRQEGTGQAAGHDLWADGGSSQGRRSPVHVPSLAEAGEGSARRARYGPPSSSQHGGDIFDAPPSPGREGW